MIRLACLVILCLAGLGRAEWMRMPKDGAVLLLGGDDFTGGKLRLSGRLRLRVRLDNSSAKADLLPLSVDEKQWQVIEDVKVAEGRDIVLEPVQPSTLPLPAVGIRVAGKVILWPDLTVEVIGPPPSEAGTIRGETGIELIPEDPSPLDPLLIWLLLLGVPTTLLLASLVFWLLVDRPRRQPALPLHQQALNALDSLRNVPALHAGLDAVLRAYVEARYGVPATRQTTQEVMAAARKSGSLTPELCAELESMLAECDRVKFAPAAEVGEAGAILALSRGWIEKTMPGGDEGRAG
jgi:hypothetical protein